MEEPTQAYDDAYTDGYNEAERISKSHIEQLEALIDRAIAVLTALNEFRGTTVLVKDMRKEREVGNG